MTKESESFIHLPAGKDFHLYWEYPNIYADKPLNHIVINKKHIRDSNPIKIEYDGTRHGFVVSQKVTPCGYLYTENSWKEVCFIPDIDESEEEMIFEQDLSSDII